MARVGFVISKTGTAGSASINRQIFEALKDEFQISQISPETLYYHRLPIVGIMFNYFTLYERRLDFDYIIATTYAGLPFLEGNHLIEIFHGVDTAAILTARKALDSGSSKGSILSKWLKITEGLFTEKLEDFVALEAVSKVTEGICAQKAEHVFAVSNAVKKDLVELFGIDQSKVKVIPNGIADYWFEEQVPFSDFGIIYPTRFDYRVFTFLVKGQDRMLEILSRVGPMPKYIYSKFSKIVPKDFQNKMKKIIKKNTGAKVIDNLHAKDLKKNYHPGYVMLSTSRYEACQLNLLEGMASKLIPVTYPVGIAPDVIRQGQNGFIVNNEKEAVEVIEYLRDKPEVRERIALNAYKTAKKLFAFDRMISEYRKTFKRIFSK